MGTATGTEHRQPNVSGSAATLPVCLPQLVSPAEGMGAPGVKGCISCHRGDSCREVAQRNSPMRHVTPAVPAACEVLVAVAQHDSPEFRRQSQEYSQVSTRQSQEYRQVSIRRSQEHGQVSSTLPGSGEDTAPASPHQLAQLG